MALTPMRLGGKKQQASAQPVQRFRPQGAPVPTNAGFFTDDEELPYGADTGDERTYNHTEVGADGRPIANPNVNKAGS